MCGRGSSAGWDQSWTGETAAVVVLTQLCWPHPSPRAPVGPTQTTSAVPGLWPTPCSILADEVCAGRGQRALPCPAPGLCFPLSCLYVTRQPAPPGLWALEVCSVEEPQALSCFMCLPQRSRGPAVKDSEGRSGPGSAPQLCSAGHMPRPPWRQRAQVLRRVLPRLCALSLPHAHTHSPPVMPGTG